jgi:magnesium transporter
MPCGERRAAHRQESVFPEDGMLRKFYVQDGLIKQCGPEEAGKVLFYFGPNQEETNKLVNEYKLDEHTLQSALDPDEIGRLEFEQDHVAIILKRPKNYSNAEQLVFKVTSLGIFVFKDFLILVAGEDLQIFEGKEGAKARSNLDILLKLFSGTIAQFFGHLKAINMISEDLEHKINSSMENRHLLSMFKLEKSLVYYLNGINSNAMVLEKIKMNAAKINFTTENAEFLDDIIIENNQCKTQADIYNNILTGLMDARGSIVNNNLNLLIKRLTIISIIFMPLNVLAGIGGMSEYSMMTSGMDWRLSYFLFTVGLGAIGFLTYLIVRNMRFEGKKKVKKTITP